MKGKHTETGMTLTELLMVVVLIAFLAVYVIGPGFPICNPLPALKASCINNLKHIGNALNNYREEYVIFRFPDTKTESAPVFFSSSSNASTLNPVLMLYRHGAFQSSKSLLCPVGAGPMMAHFDETDVGLQNQPQDGMDNLRISGTELVASNYLFTRFYTPRSAENRVIAGDAGKSEIEPYSPNHAATSVNEQDANVLFADGHAKPVTTTGKAEGAGDDGNLWDSADAPTAEDVAKTQIGHY